MSNSQISILRKIRENLGDFLLCMVLILLPLSIAATNIFAALLLIWWVVTLRPADFIQRFKSNRNAILALTAPFLFVVLSLSYTSAFSRGVHTVEKSLLLLIFPLLMATFPFRKSVDFFLQVFTLVVSFMCFTCLGYGLYRFFFTNPSDLPVVGDFFTSIATRWNALTNTNLVLPFNISPIYLSMYVSFALIVIFFRSRLHGKYRVIIFIILLFFQVLLGSRIGLAAFILAGIAGLYFLPTRSRKFILIAAAGCTAAVIVAVVFHPVLRKRYSTELIAYQIPASVSEWNAISLRNAVWQCSGKIFVTSPVWGKGAGGASADREECYKSYSFYGFFGTDFNSHNQYIEYALTGGILLVGLFVFQLGFSFAVALKNQNQVHFLFLTIFAVVAIGESLLEAHKGIVFFSCFNSMFIFRASKDTVNV